MKFYKNLFIGKTINNKDEIIRLINENTPIFNVYVICKDKKSQNSMEIMNSSELFKSFNLKKDYLIIGIANGKKEAFLLVKEIFEKHYLGD